MKSIKLVMLKSYFPITSDHISVTGSYNKMMEDIGQLVLSIIHSLFKSHRQFDDGRLNYIFSFFC